MEKQLTKIFKRIRRYIYTQEGMKEIEKAFIEYAEYQHDKTLRNNRKIVNYYVKGMQDEFMRLKTHGEGREEARHNKKTRNKTK